MGRTSGHPSLWVSRPVLSNADQKQQKKKKKRERDKQLILEVVLVSVCLRFYSKKQAFTGETKCIRVS